ncbi:EsaB/YukD family protein [Corynebacterium heidelbergense]|uniref:Type VII secretion integral membrane protein EccD n=1 Tax=Corynebacterium heidelbergense TaxID=2055947 RepID=A0A364V796_9CORY|nr:EsaB/YukD family protein [Corynebacterium heidelbergense]RAV32509.1 hypothetical protein DLJ54_02940 [Corynebacterium heidelbergense]
MLAVSIAIPARNSVVEAAIADHIPVAELIPHLVDPEPGQHWVLSRATGDIRPEHSLDQAGVRPGERLTLEQSEVGRCPTPPIDAVDELTGSVGNNHSTWICAIIAALFAIRSVPVWNPLQFHPARQLAFLPGGLPGMLAGHAGGPETAEGADDAARQAASQAGQAASWLTDSGALVPLVLIALAALATAALSLHDRRFVPIAAILGFGAGLHVNVMCGCLLATALVWRRGFTRVLLVTLTAFAAINFTPGVTLLIALVALAISGQIAVGVAGIKLPRVPATGVFREPVDNSAGSAVPTHSALVVACCITIVACVMQILPPGSQHPSGWVCALLVMVVLTGVSSRDCRPVHATAVTVMAAVVALWLAWHVSWGVLVLSLLAVPLIKPTSPLFGRAVDAVENVAFAACVPLALHTTGLFEAIRGIG